MTREERVRRAKIKLILDHPFIGSLLLHLVFDLDSKRNRTAWTDGVKLGFYGNFIDTLSDMELMTVIAHELFHIVGGHCWRRGIRDHKQWNIASDYAINEIIRNSNMQLIADALWDPKFIKMSAEEIYLFRQGETPPISFGGPSGGNGAGEDQQEEDNDEDLSEDGDENHGKPKSGQPEDEDQPPDGQPEDEDQPPDGQPEDEDQPPDGQPEDEDQPPDEDFSTFGEVFDSPKDVDTRQLEADWKVAIQQAVTMAQGAGKMSQGLDRFVKAATDTYVDWRKALRRFLDMYAKNDYSWTKPNARYAQSGFYLPAIHSEQMRNLVIAIDTSGSISHAVLAMFEPEIKQILVDYQTDATVLYCDDQIHGEPLYIKSGQPFELKPLGGGGTDFRPVFKWVDDNGIIPSCLIYLTDLDCYDYPDQVPEYPVVWIAYNNIYRRRTAPFGEVYYVVPSC